MAKVFRVNVVTPKGTLSYPYLKEPDTTSEFADNKFKTTFMIDKSEDISKLTKAIEDVAKQAFGSSKFANPIRDGDELDNDFAKGKWLITAKNNEAPSIVDAARKDIPSENAPSFGDVCKLSITVSPYEKPKKGINFYLKGIQLLKRNNTGGDCGFEVEDEYATSSNMEETYDDDVPF